ncbi:MAG: DUF433 domain-containing protein [Candidatus Heimdallarchaeota archaeon]|nr:DUF433 domain-containing protein [Candidatus Heimdallarchaeota archaeon]
MTTPIINERIEINPKILVGKAIIKGTRISVEFILELLANNWTYETILENYPQLQKADILAAIDYARIVI